MTIQRRSLLTAALFAVPCALIGRQADAQGTAADATPLGPWPHSATVNGTTVTIYEPQAIDWANHKTLRARAAVAITPADSSKPFLGTIEFSGTTQVGTTNDVVYFSQPTLLSSNFPSLDTSQAYQLQSRISAYLATMPAKEIPLNTVLLSLNEQPAPAAPVNNTPPIIYYSAQRASLVVFDGEPVMTTLASTGLKYAVNTNWAIIQDPAAGDAWYLLNNGSWLVAQAFTGPYEPAEELPPAFYNIPDDADFGVIRNNVPGQPLADGTVPIIFVSTKPATIIVTAGTPQYQPVPDTSLQAVTNTGVVLFRYTRTNTFYYLISGRWFSARSLYGPWTFATPDLPPDFAHLSPDGRYGNLLASVPGTTAARIAVLKAQVPTQATLSRSTATVTVIYAGAPAFLPIADTTMLYAANTSYEVISVSGVYYCCYQGAWFVSYTPSGPWTLAASVPEVIYTIPPSCPVYNVTYVQVYSATPAVVTYGYTAGYVMGYVTAGVVAYGAGYFYTPYVAVGVVPAYFPYPYTYAAGVYYNTATGAWATGGYAYGAYGRGGVAGVAYNPHTGAYTGGAAVYGPYGGAGAWSRYNPSTGTYSHGSATWGPGYASAHAEAYNPSTGRYGETTQNANAYGRWGQSNVSGPNGDVHTASGGNAYGRGAAFSASNGAEGGAVQGRYGNSAGAVRTANGNVYAGTDGSVYEHTSSGWSKWENGSWQSASSPSTTRDYSQLNRDQTARQYGGYNRGGYTGGYGGGYGGGGFRRPGW